MNLRRPFHTSTLLGLIGLALPAMAIMGGIGPEHDKPETDQPIAEQDLDRSSTDHDQRASKKRILEIRVNPEALRNRLNRSILRAEHTLKLHRAALVKLDEGASVSEVLSELKRRNLLPKDDSGEPRTRPARAQQGNGSTQSPRAGRNQQEGTPGSASNARSHADRLTPREREMMHRFIRENFPDLSTNLQRIVEHDPGSADRLLARMSPRIREILLLKETQPDLAKIKTAEMRIGMAFVEASRIYRMTLNRPNATESEREEALARLREVASERFDVQLRAKQLEIANLESRLNELKGSLGTIEDRREAEINHMVTAAERSARERNGRPRSTKRSRDD